MDKNIRHKTMGLFLGVLAAFWALCGCGSTTDVYLPDGSTDAKAATEETADHMGGDVAGTGTSAQDADGKTQAGAEEEICVYVCGAVENQGVYMLPQGSRVADAVEAAGGISKNACTDYWNLAEPLGDGQMIRIPTKKEAADMRAAESSADVQGGLGAGSGQEPGLAADGKININTASKEQLMQIPGVGDTRAESIISYRESSGGFSDIEDIMNVSGIKEGLFAKMKDYISTS